MKDCFLDFVTALEVFDDYAFQQCRGDSAVPDALRIHNHNRPAFTYSEARRLAPFHPAGTEQQTLSLEQCRQQ